MRLRVRTVVPFALLLLAAVAVVAVRRATVDCGQIADMDECETTWGCTVSREWYVALPGQPPPEQLHGLRCVRAGSP
jgi:hypothetical protein